MFTSRKRGIMSFSAKIKVSIVLLMAVGSCAMAAKSTTGKVVGQLGELGGQLRDDLRRLDARLGLVDGLVDVAEAASGAGLAHQGDVSVWLDEARGDPAALGVDDLGALGDGDVLADGGDLAVLREDRRLVKLLASGREDLAVLDR